MTEAEELILTNQEYAIKQARILARRLPSRLDFEELKGFAMVGLAEAAQAFKAELRVAFTTFAYYRIRGAIYDGVRKMTWLPPALRTKLARESQSNEALADVAEEASASSDAEHAAREFETAVRRLGTVFLLSRGGGGREDEDGASDEPVDDTRAEDVAENNELLVKLKETLAKLPEGQMAILRMIYFEEKSMAECGAALGKDKATISRQHAQILDALGKALGRREAA